MASVIIVASDRTPLAESPGPRDLPESARHVLDALRAGPRSFRDLDRELALPGRTIRWAVRRLRDHGVVGQRYSLRDGRTSYFFLVDGTPRRHAQPHRRAL